MSYLKSFLREIATFIEMIVTLILLVPVALCGAILTLAGLVLATCIMAPTYAVGLFMMLLKK